MDLPDFSIEQSPVELPEPDYGTVSHEKMQSGLPKYWPLYGCGFTWSEPLNEADRLLADPRTIHFHVGKTYEVYIPIMGQEPVKKIHTMQVIQPNIPDDWVHRIY